MVIGEYVDSYEIYNTVDGDVYAALCTRLNGHWQIRLNNMQI